MAKVLYISYDGMTDPLGQSQVIPYLIGLQKKGHRITLLSCEKKERYHRLKGEINQLLEQNQIDWHPIPYSNSIPVISQQTTIGNLKRTAKKLIRSKDIDFTHCRSYMAALAGLSMKRKLNIPFVFDMRGFWADERVDGGIWKLTNPVQRFLYNHFKKKEREFIRESASIVALTENARREINTWNIPSAVSDKITVIPCCADLELFSAVKNTTTASIRESLQLNSDNCVITYLGSVGTWYLLDEMLDFFACFLEYYPRAVFLFITQDDKRLIEEKARNKAIPDTALRIVSAKRNEVPPYLSVSTAALYFIKPCYSKKASSPTKMAELMGMGIPIITNRGIGDSDEQILQSKAGLLVDSFSESAYKEIIKEFNVILTADKVAISRQAQHYFSLETGVNAYHAIYCNMNRQ